MIKVCILGSGNVAQHLIGAFSDNPSVDLVQVFARNTEALRSLVPHGKLTNDLSKLVQADIYLLAVSDTAIAEVSSALPFTGRLVAHTSGSMGIAEIGEKTRSAVFYPVQTFTKSKPVDFWDIPICIETAEHGDLKTLKALAQAISGHVYELSSAQRKSLHIAAVFACNFTNHLYAVADRICTENEIPFELLKPLIMETAEKIKVLSPEAAQTGPAKRNDQKTITEHMSTLKNENMRNIYELLTYSIQHGGEKL